LQLADGWLRLFAVATKNGKTRAVKLPGDVNEALTVCAKGKAPDALLFTWQDGSEAAKFCEQIVHTNGGCPRLLVVSV